MIKKLVVIDNGNIIHKAIFAYSSQYKRAILNIVKNYYERYEDIEVGDLRAAKETLDEKIRHHEIFMMYPPSTYLKMVIGYLKKIGVTLDDKIVMAEDYGSWRKEIDKNYKAQRKAFRESKEEASWWTEQYGKMNELMIKLEECLPWNFVKIYKCFAGFTRIDTPNGMKKIKDLQVGDYVNSWNEKTRKIELAKITKKYISETNERYIIKFGQFNTPIYCTGNHPFYTKRGWIEAKNLSLNDIIYTSEDYFLDNYKKRWDWIGYLHGYLMGDGWNYTKTYHFDYTSKDLEGLIRIRSILKRALSKNCKILKDSRGYYRLTTQGRRLYDSINKYIMNIDNIDYKKGFLAGFYDSEGTLTKRNIYRFGIVRISNCNYKVIRYCCDILKELGIKYKLNKFYDKKYTIGYIYCLDINKQINISKFFEKINTAIKRKRPNTIRNGLTIMSINRILSRKLLKVYNLEVSPNNTFFANTCLVHNCESDDVASCAIRFLEAEEKILVSSDEDWQMLCVLPNVKVFSPYTKKYKIIKNPEKILLKKIRGDKCLEGHTPIVMANDTRKMIKDLRRGEKVATYNFKNKKIENQEILSIGKSFSTKRRYIYLDNEKVPLKITLEHKLYTKRGWIEAKNIRCSDIIYKYNELRYMIKTNIQHNFYKLGYLHGYLIGDGSVSKYKGITYTSTDLDSLERIQKYILDLFNKPLSIDTAKEENYKPHHKQVYEINISSELKDNFFKYFMLKPSWNNKLIRNQYFKGFIAGFFDAEGSCSPKILNLKNKEQRIVWGIILCNTNKKYIDYVINCLKLFKIHYKIYRKILPSKKIFYKIELTETTKNVNFFLFFRPAIKRKYPDLKLLSNGKRVRTVKTILTKRNFKFENYNIKTKNRNFFANDVLVHNSDNLLEEPKTEAEFEKRKMIVDLIHLPLHIEQIIKPVIESLPLKNLYVNKVPFRSCQTELKKLYNL